MKIKYYFRALTFAILLSLTLQAAPVWAKPLALVWNGPGVCPVGCAFAAAKVARMAGFKTKYINPKNMARAPFARAQLWVQPGGHSAQAADAMGPDLLEKIRQFVVSGGGYAGFCAGMFLATSTIGTLDQAGIGIIPGKTELFRQDGDSGPQLLKVTIDGKSRSVYYSGGPLLHLSDSDTAARGVTVLARYQEDQSIAAVSAPYGAGHVSVAGFHPEAGWAWKLAHWIRDPDGSDRWFAVKMIKLATPNAH